VEPQAPLHADVNVNLAPAYAHPAFGSPCYSTASGEMSPKLRAAKRSDPDWLICFAEHVILFYRRLAPVTNHDVS
jgi:hypothetical protein